MLPKHQTWCAYVLTCSDGSLYTGATNNLWKRFQTHLSGKGSKYVRSRLPARLSWSSRYGSKPSALRLEAEIKSLSRHDKIRFIQTEVGFRYRNSFKISENPLLKFREESGESFSLEERDALQRSYSWAIPTDAAISVLKGIGPIVEMGAGLGYWAAIMRNAGMDVEAFDASTPGSCILNPWHPGGEYFTPVRPGTPKTLADFEKRSLLLCWPPLGSSMASMCLDFWKGRTLALVGDDEEDVADVVFHDRLRNEFNLHSVTHIPGWNKPDALTIWRKK